jgi:phosphoribosylanthranilate isomerase
MTARVKVCGIRRVDDALLAADLGACAVGFVFWPRSPRFIDPYRARTIVAALPPCVAPVGVFVDQPMEYVTGVAKLLNLAAVQLHGSEAVETYQRSAHRVIKAVAVPATFDTRSLDRIPQQVTVCSTRTIP